MSSIAYGDLQVNRSPVPHEIDACHTGSVALKSAGLKSARLKPSPVSAEIRAANSRLHALRQTTATQNSGWLSAITQKLSEEPATEKPTNEPALISPQHLSDSPIILHPSLATAWLQEGHETVGRVWLLARHIDSRGRGWLTVDALRTALTDKTSPMRICGWRRLRQLLQAGDGIFWTRDKDSRLWLRSAANVALNLGIERLTGRPVELSLSSICSDVRTLRAHLYASFHSGRINAAPISRLSLESATGVPERTQRIYDRVAGVERESNIAVGAEVSAENRQQHYAQRTGAFELIDKTGKQGEAGKRYLAWRLPNSYSTIHPQTNTGNVKRTNRVLRRLQRQNPTDLVNLRAQGNGQITSRDSVFVKQSMCALQTKTGREQYWQDARSGIWYSTMA